MNGILQDVRYAWRGLRKHPGFALLAVLILALASGATNVMFTLVSGVLLRPLAYPEPDRLVTVHIQVPKIGDVWGFSYPDFLDCRHGSRSFEQVAAWTYGGGTVSAPGEAQYVEGRRISSELFSVLQIKLLKGRAFGAAEDRIGAAPVAIISKRLWQQRYGGDPHAVGMRLLYDGGVYTIVGIAPSGFQLDGDADVFTPLGQNNDLRMRWRGARFLHVVARMRRNVTLREAQSELAVRSQQLAKQYPDDDGGITLVPHPLQSEVVQHVRPTLWLLLGAVGVVLLIGCVNVASLFLTRIVSRQREFALRLALGARRGRLLRQCLTESGTLGVCGGAIGLLLAIAGTQPFVRFWPYGLPRADEIHLDWRVLLFSIAMSILTGILFGLVPALRANNNSAIEQTLRSQSRSSVGSARRPLSGFVVCQIALAMVLLSAAGVLGRTLLRLSALNPGIDIHNVLTARVAISPEALSDPAKARADWQQLLDDVKGVPAVRSAALTDIVPMREGENVLGYASTAAIPSPNQLPQALASAVTPDYMAVMRLPLLSGRFFDENDKLSTAQVVVIDENLARRTFGDGDAVGKLLWIPAMGNKPVQVVGVVGHVRNWGLAGDDLSRIHDQIYYPLAQVPDKLVHLFASIISIVVRTNAPPLSVIQTLQKQARGAAGDQTLYEVFTMEELTSASLAQQRFLLVLFATFSALALLLACVGIYSVVAYLTSQRVPEFGVRIAVGANSADILKLVLRESLVLVLAGVGIGILGSIGSARILQSLVPAAQSPLASTLSLVLPVLIGVVVFASYIPARRAAKVDPIVALRYE